MQMSAVVEKFYRILLALVAVLLAVLTVVVTYQVIGRYVPFIPRPLWTEEISRLCLAWLVFLGAALAIRRSEHFVIDAIPRRVDERIGRGLQLLVLLLMGVAAVVILIGGVGLTQGGLSRVSTTSGIHLAWAYAAVPVAAACMLVFGIELAGRVLRGEPLEQHATDQAAAGGDDANPDNAGGER